MGRLVRDAGLLTAVMGLICGFLAAAAVAAPVNTAWPVIGGTAQDGQTLVSSTGSWASTSPPVTYAYAWQRCNATGANCVRIANASSHTYRTTASDVGHEVSVAVSASDGSGRAPPVMAAPVGPVSAPAPPNNTTAPSISGIAQDGQTVIARPGRWSSPDSLTYHYQWQRCDPDGAICTNIRAATKAAYTPSASDVDQSVTVSVTAVDREHQSGQVAGPILAVAAPAPPSNTVLPSVAGPTQVGQALFVINGAWRTPDVLSYTYQWRRCNAAGADCTDIDGQTSSYYRLGPNDLDAQISARVTGTDVSGQSASAVAGPVGPITPGADLTGIHKIQHVVIVMQENRSFDSYFGTFPGADGIPANACVPDPHTGTCVQPYHDNFDINGGGPHGPPNAQKDIDGGAMDGFIGQSHNGPGCTQTSGPCAACAATGQTQCADVLGYHDGADIPNYWKYAQDYVLQDHMFESGATWSAPEHLFMVSEWSAACADPLNPQSCTNALGSPNDLSLFPPLDQTPEYAWTDLTYLLHNAGVSWGYYVFAGQEPDCEIDTQVTCTPKQQGPQTAGIWNPLPHFEDVHQDGQLGNIQSLNGFFTAARDGSLPAVSWVIPNNSVSEHPPSQVSAGQTYVTGLVNAIMQSPDWSSTAIFVSWDDWGGFYDHVVPPTIDHNGYGIRVPGLVISPYAKPGYIDHQTLSHDAYVKFIEDDFLSGQRLDPATDGRPDPRPDVRETAPQLGDLSSDFDFTQPPRSPEILSVCPQTDLVPTPSC